MSICGCVANTLRDRRRGARHADNDKIFSTDSGIMLLILGAALKQRASPFFSARRRLSRL
jgi:hypothetical protein